MDKKYSKIYISCPMTVPLIHLEAVNNKLKKFGLHTRYWERGTPYNEVDAIKYCDAMVVILPNNAFEMCFYSIPRGTLSEIEIAKRYEKPIYLAYRKLGGEIEFYDVDIINSTNMFKGMITIKTFYDRCDITYPIIDISGSKTTNKEKNTTNYSKTMILDRRVLLLI